MVRGALAKNLRRTIVGSFGRFMAILAIIALGAGFLVGLQGTKTAMIATAQSYVNNNRLFDFRVLSTYGYDQQAVEALSRIPGIAVAEGSVSQDVLMQLEKGGDDRAYKLMTLPGEVNVPMLRAGRMPQSVDECLADSSVFSPDRIGEKLYVSLNNDSDTLDRVTVREVTIVGLAASPLYINFERGGTSLGSGQLSGFLLVMPELLDMDGVYTDVYLKLGEDYEIYSDQYDNVLSAMALPVEQVAQAQADRRYNSLLSDAEQALAEGQAEYDDKAAEADKELSDAQQELDEGKQDLEEGKQTLLDAENQLLNSQSQVDYGWRKVIAGQKELNAQRANAEAEFARASATLSENLEQIRQGQIQIADGLEQIQDGLVQLENGIAQAEAGKAKLEKLLSVLQGLKQVGQRAEEALNKALEADPENEELLAAKQELDRAMAELDATLNTYQAQYNELMVTISELYSQQQQLIAAKAELEANREVLAEGFAQAVAGMDELERQRADAMAKLADAQKTIDNTIAQLVYAQKQILSGKDELQQGKDDLKDAEDKLNQGQQELDDARQEANEGLADGKKTLEEAREEVRKLRNTKPEVYVLDRNTNVGYVCFENDSNIVAGISRVFPLFFFLVAALICITTMTKMVDEERTQIGVLKALGYSNGTISTKYLAYSGLASVLGCLVGIAIGTVLFPSVIWIGYKIMYDFSDRITLVVDWPLCLRVAGSYVAAMLAVTWLSCRRELVEVSAELIRPKAPQVGRRLLMERLPFWKNLKFLQKVTARNVFRYRKRLFMTLLGVGGCTALLVTGFGLKDSIANVVNEQYEQISVYDISVTFTRNMGPEDQLAFREEAGEQAQVLFLHSSAGELHFGHGSKNVTILASEEGMDGFMNLAYDGVALEFPGLNEALVSRGTAEDMGISPGDMITVQTDDMRQMPLRVAGIFDNKFYQYVVVSQATLNSQLGRPGAIKTAYLTLPEDTDPHAFGAKLSDLDSVGAVSVNEAMRQRVNGMFDSLDYIIALVVVCAAALAFIVLYNLTNININERLRELATLKVLGFTPMETASYVFSENLILAVMGAVLGLVMGKFLHAFVMSQVKVDMVFFDARVTVLSYAISLVLTLLFALGVDAILYRSLESINMADALKSVE